MDWKKEIKLSQLVPGFAKARVKEGANPSATPQRSKAQIWRKELRVRKTVAERRLATPRKAAQLVGLKIGASQLSAARIRNNGHFELVQLARTPLAHGV